jgi:hypothetical protein
MHTYYSRFIPEGVADSSQIFSEIPTFCQYHLAMIYTEDSGGKPIAVHLVSRPVLAWIPHEFYELFTT